jgi:hypothetical protein
MSAPETPCHDCGLHEGDGWSVDNELWNLVMGGPEAKDDPGGLLCLSCFRKRAEAVFADPDDRPIWRLERLPALVIPGPVRESPEGPEAGHRFRFTVDSCGASAIRGPDDPEPHSWRDSDWWSRTRTIEVRAFSLMAAIKKLVDVPFYDWMASAYDDARRDEEGAQ